MKIFILLCEFIILFRLGFAQTMYINELNGNLSTFLYSGISTISFQNFNLIIKEKVGTNQIMPINSIRTLTFTKYTYQNDKNDIGLTINLFPNPVNAILNVQLPIIIDKNVRLEILDLTGSILYLKIINNHSSKNTLSIPIQTFNNGIYLCRLMHGEKINTQKFIKN